MIWRLAHLKANKEAQMRSRSTLTPRSRLKTKASGFSCGARKNIITKQLHHWSIDEKGSLYNMRCTLAEEDDRRQSIHRCSGKPNVKPLGENISNLNIQLSLVTTLLPPWLVASSISPSASEAMLLLVDVLKVFESGADFCPSG